MEIETLENGEAQRQPPTFDSSTLNVFNMDLRLILKFKDVVYKVKDSSGGKENKILNGVSGVVQPGEILAMLGPSGSGKTTLLTALGGRLDHKHLDGRITYNGRPHSSSIKKKTGFVTQDDVMHRNLTVTETLVFTALLRLPNSLTKYQKVEHANSVISQLGLTKCKDSRIGGPFTKGISGGERRRVSIGQELLTKPSILFLDEPTSGLDSTTAQLIVSTLQDLATCGMTIVMSIHQPSSRLFYMFDKVLLLCEGNPLYFGVGGAVVVDYFSSIGLSPPVAMNPSDFLLDLANGITSDNQKEDTTTVKQTLITAYRSNLAANLDFALREGNGIKETQQKNEFTTTWWQQFSVLLQRGIKERRHESFSTLKVVQILLISLVCAMLWWNSSPADIQDQAGILFFYTNFCGIYSVYQAIYTFPQEKNMIAKERSSGMYRLSSYLAARTCVDLPMELTLPSTFLTITYWMVGLKRDAAAYSSALAAVLLCTLMGQGLGQALGALIMDVQLAGTTGAVLTISFQLIGGFYVQHVPAIIAWIKYVSYIRYSYELLLVTQYRPGQTYHCETNKVCLVEEHPMIKSMGLHGQAISVAALMIMIVVCRVIAYLALMRVGLARK